MGLFEKKPGSGVWWIRYSDGEGKIRREKVGTKAECVRKYSERKQQIREGRYRPPQAGGRIQTFQDLAVLAMDNKKPHVRPSSYNGELIRLKIIYPMLGHIAAKAVTSTMIEETLTKLMQGRNLEKSSGNRYRSTLSSVFTYGMKAGYTFFNPVSRVRCFKENNGRIRCLTPEEEEKLRAVIRAKCPEREPEFDLALYTGMRRGEQFRLKWSGVDLEKGLLEVYGKTGRRFINLNSTTKAALEKLKERRPEGAIYVCPNTKYDEQRDHLRWFEDAVREAGIENFRRHDLRHTFASRLANDNVDIYIISQLLGHRTAAMSQRYTHLSREYLRREIEKIGRKSDDD